MTTSSVATEFLYDGDRLVAEYNGSGTMLRRYVHGSGVDEPIVWYEGSALTDRRHLITDRQGSIAAVDGAAVDRYQYGAYGEPNAWTGSSGAMLSRFRYTGQIALPEIALYHYKARVYDPVLGRFLQTDPVGYRDDLNLYTYVRNDAVNRGDPSGRCGQVTKNGHTYDAGVCGTDTATTKLVDQQMNDPNSHVRAVDTAARAAGVPIHVVEGQTHPDSHGNLVPVKGAATDQATGLFSNGDTIVGVRVTIDPTDRATVRGHDPVTGATTHAETDQETLEHEVAGHANDFVNGTPPNETNAINAENQYRQTHGSSFVRDNHDGSVAPRTPAILDNVP